MAINLLTLLPDRWATYYVTYYGVDGRTKSLVRISASYTWTQYIIMKVLHFERAADVLVYFLRGVNVMEYPSIHPPTWHPPTTLFPFVWLDGNSVLRGGRFWSMHHAEYRASAPKERNAKYLFWPKHQAAGCLSVRALALGWVRLLLDKNQYYYHHRSIVQEHII